MFWLSICSILLVKIVEIVFVQTSDSGNFIQLFNNM